MALRLSLGGLDSDNNGYQYDFLREEHYAGVFSWKLGDRQQLTIEADRERRNDYLDERGYALTHPGYIGNAAAIASGQSVTAWVAANFGATAPVFTTFAPIYPANDPYGRKYAYNTDNFEKFFDWDVDVDYRLKINDHIVWETALSRGQDDQPGIRANNGDETPFANGTVNMQFQYFENDRNSIDVNNKVTFKFDVGPTKNTLQVGQQFQEVLTDQPGYITPAGSFSSNNLSAVITGFNPATATPITGALALTFANQPINDWRHAVDITAGYYVALQSSFFNDRVHLLAGARYDVITGSIGWSIRPTNATSEGPTTATTPQVGIITEIIPGLSAFATYSRSIEPQNGSIDVLGNVAGPIRSTGLDAGFKTNFLDGRVSTTLDYFNLKRADIASTDTAKQVATGLSPWFIFGTVNQANGVALDTNVSVTDTNNLIVGYQHMLKANITSAPAPNTNMIGQPLADVPTNMFSLWDRYTFKSGPVQGLSLAFGGRYSSSAALSSSPTTTVRVPPFTILNAMASRSFTLGERRVRVQLNVTNLTDKLYRDGANAMFGPPRKILLTFDTRF
jgi:iron complex outermembrane receptor protein